MLKMVGTAVVAVILVLSLIELGCFSTKSTRALLGADESGIARVPPDLPLGSEEDATDSASPILTR